MYVSGPVAYEILALLHSELPGINSQQNIGESALLSHLVEHSPWIESAFTGDVFGKGEPLRYPLGLQSEVMSRSDAERLLAELKDSSARSRAWVTSGRWRRCRIVLSRITLRRGTAESLAKISSRTPDASSRPAPGESVADRIANLKRMLRGQPRRSESGDSVYVAMTHGAANRVESRLAAVQQYGSFRNSRANGRSENTDPGSAGLPQARHPVLRHHHAAQGYPPACAA